MNRIGYYLRDPRRLGLGLRLHRQPVVPDARRPTPPPGSTSGGTNDTFDHDNNGISPWDLLRRIEVEGPPAYTSHVHSCPKVRYKTLGNVLASLGINAGERRRRCRPASSTRPGSTRWAARTTRTASARTSHHDVRRVARVRHLRGRRRRGDRRVREQHDRRRDRALPGRDAVRRDQRVPAERHHVPHRVRRRPPRTSTTAT